jgi:hypothetical protein
LYKQIESSAISGSGPSAAAKPGEAAAAAAAWTIASSSAANPPHAGNKRNLCVKYYLALHTNKIFQSFYY